MRGRGAVDILINDFRGSGFINRVCLLLLK
ncbi:Uncharacterised protein [Leclercia adecarboxylata]|uniref:Uncharacterized protein n=1 Tax=Leclercia adecarboxylata TaxID=83655 RepID=A0A4U9IPW2_9ENTR|nr:Uncharacterised protein [Leclercia adecarboxylata]